MKDIVIEKVQENLPNIYAPEFIPFYIYIQNKYKLSDLETKIYGFVRYYTTSCNEMFYFSNQQLGKIFDRNSDRISKAVSTLVNKDLIEAEFTIKSSGGTFRKMKTRLGENTYSDSAKTPSETRRKRLPNNNSINNNNIKDTYIQVLDHWNSKNIIQHKSLIGTTGERIEKHINGRLSEGYSIEDIKTTIDNYAEILNDEKYFFKYKWPLYDFLIRGFEKFRDLDIAKANYLKNKGGINGGYKHPDQAEKGKYDDIVER
jgi:hypothetical protein